MKRMWVMIISAVCLATALQPASAQETLYALGNPSSPVLYVLDPVTGGILESHPVTNAEALFGGLACDAALDLYSIDGYNDANSDRLFRIDRLTGDGTVVGDTGFNWNFRFLYAHPITDVLYGGRDNELYTLDRTTGAATFIASITGSTLDQTTSLGIDSQGNAYITDIGETGLFSLDLSTGQATHLGNLDPGGYAYYYDLAFDSNDVLYATHNSNRVDIIDVDNVTATYRFSGSYRGLTFLGEGQGEEIPTVSEWGMVVLTLLLLTAATVLIGRRRVAAA